MKAFSKTVWRMFKENKGRFWANLLICLIATMIGSGLSSMLPIYREGFKINYNDGNAADITLIDKTGTGFTQEDIDYVLSDSDVDIAETYLYADMEQDNDEVWRFYFENVGYVGEDNEDARQTDLVTLLEGSKPEKAEDLSDIQILAVEGNLNRTYYEVGDKIELNYSGLESVGLSSIEATISGIIKSPLLNSVQKENAQLDQEEGEEDKYVTSVFYIDRASLPEEVTLHYSELGDQTVNLEDMLSAMMPEVDMAIRYKGEKNYFEDDYHDSMETKKDELINHFGEEEVAALTLEDNVSYALYKEYEIKVEHLAIIIPFFFLLVCALVNYITITRLIKDERPMVGTYTSLGVPKGRIVQKFLFFSSISVTIGVVAGILLGIPFLPRLILPAYQSVFTIPSITITYAEPTGYVSAAILIVITLLVTLFSTLYSLKETPAALMLRKAPKPGKKILMERMFFWKKIPFRYKSAFRNIARQKVNSWLTACSVILSTLLLLLGFSLMNCSEALKEDSLFGNVASSMGSISLVIVIFAVAMTIVVIYSLVNMNISERQRELATLKVLGYYDMECSNYTFREIMILSIASSLIGLPISALILWKVYDYLGFGSIADVKWWSYVLSFVILNLTVVLVNYILYPKIRNVDMNDSLKTLD